MGDGAVADVERMGTALRRHGRWPERVAFVRVSYCTLEEWFAPRLYRSPVVQRTNLPEDARLVFVDDEPAAETCALVFTSAAFAVVADGAVIPAFRCLAETTHAPEALAVQACDGLRLGSIERGILEERIAQLIAAEREGTHAVGSGRLPDLRGMRG